MDELHYLSLTEVAGKIAARELSPVDVTRAQLARIEALDPELHAYVTLLPDLALAEAERAAREIADGRRRGPLHGVPIAVKDLYDTKGVRTSCGMQLFADRVPDADACVVERLREAGAVLLGKLQMTEGAGTVHHPSVTPPVNPFSAEHWTGVSSSGSAVATAAGLCYGSLGSDTGGSIRFPSACCGLSGIKPTYGRVPRHGVFPLAESLDHVGPICRSVADAAAMLVAIAGHDPRDPTSVTAPVPDFAARIDDGIAGLRIGYDEAYATESVDAELAAAVRAAGEVLGELGAELREVRVPVTRELVGSWLPILGAEVALAHADTFPARAEEYGPGLRALLERGHRTSGLEYAAAHLEQLAFSARLVAMFEEVDLLLCPAMLGPPPRDADLRGLGLDAGALAVFLKFTAPYDNSGSPTVTLPCGFTADGLPLAFQLVGRHLEEDLLCRSGHAYQSATDWHTRHPAIEA